MSLLSESFEKFNMIDKRTVPDGYGGYRIVYELGAAIDAAVTFDTSIEARVGEKQGVTSLYTITTSRSLTLEYHDLIKRERDGKVFRITSDGDDKFTPASAQLDMRQVTAEEFVLTEEVSNG